MVLLHFNENTEEKVQAEEITRTNAVRRTNLTNSKEAVRKEIIIPGGGRNQARGRGLRLHPLWSEITVKFEAGRDDLIHIF